MLVNSISGYSNPSFQRKPNPAEMKMYTKSLKEGLRVLEKDMGFIIHNSSVPSNPKNNIGIGSLLSKNAELSFIPFLAANAFTAIQQEPDSIRGQSDVSPYAPQSTAKNIYMIPIERLATEEYGNLIPQEEIQTVVRENSSRKEPNSVDYSKTAKTFDKILSSAYSAFIKSNSDNKKIAELKNEFEDYKQNNKEELEPKAIYEILAKKYENEDWHTWNEEHRNLYMNNNQSLINNIVKEHENQIDFYTFKQWLISREVENANKRNDNYGIKIIGDSPIAYSAVEVWMNQDVFMDGWALGCPPDYFSQDGQRWGFPVIKPETIFNEDGTLGKGGKLIQKHYEKLFETSSGGARIDHVIGLIDPFVYLTKEPKMNDKNSGRLYSSPHHPILGRYAKHTEEEYAATLEKIVFPAAAKYGLSKDKIICEDLGTLTEPVQRIMNKLNLSGISITQYDYRGKHTPAKNVIMTGSHDNESLIEYTNKIFNDKHHLMEKTNKLAEDTAVPNENIEYYRAEMQNNKSKFISASFTELFTSPAKKIQIFFTTFCGIGKTYNIPGETDGCWTLRMPEDYDTLYWENVRKGTAINIPESIARAIRNKGLEFASKHQNLLVTLDKFTQILKN